MDSLTMSLCGAGMATATGDMPAEAASAAHDGHQLKGLSFLSHDLNNNLGAVTLHLAVLRRRLEGRPDLADAVATLDLTRESIEQTVRGMRRLLDYGRLRATGAKRRTGLGRVDPRAVAVRLTEHHRPQAEAKGIEVVVDIPQGSAIEADEDLLALVLQNLMGNAVKYSDAGGHVVVALTEARHSPGDGWALSVSDTGRGISPGHLADIFTAFRRGDASGAEEGVGLGLAIAAEAARLMDAELSVASAVCVGSTFLLTPRRRATPRRGGRGIRREFVRGRLNGLI